MEDKSTNKTKDTRQDEREYFDWDWKMSDDMWEELKQSHEEFTRRVQGGIPDLYRDDCNDPNVIRIQKNITEAKERMTELVDSWAPHTEGMQLFFVMLNSFGQKLSRLMMTRRSFRAEMVYDMEASRVSVAFYQAKDEANPLTGKAGED